MTLPTVFVFGATSDGGTELCRRLRADDVHVIAGVRASSDCSGLEALGVECRQADAMQPDQLRDALQDLDSNVAIASLLGGMPSKAASRVDSEGINNVIDAAVATGVRRFVLVSSVGCNESRKALIPIPRFILRHTIREKSKSENHLRESQLDWTIIRPGRLTTIFKKPTGRGILIEHPLAAGAITRVDLGELVYKAVTSEQAIGKIYTAADQRHAKIIGGLTVEPVQL